MITKGQILKRLDEVKASRAKLIADINAHDGAIQDLEFWLGEIEKAEQPKKLAVVGGEGK